MTANEKRLSIVEKYKTILGRNHYSQPLRNYCFHPYKDGNYYSDCSSAVSFSYEEAGFNFGNMTTMDMIVSKKMKDVNVIIKEGIIQNPEVLRIADLLLFAGDDVGRKNYDYVGHVEMVAKINKNEIILYGHGQGFPREIEMNKYCKQRYELKADTPLGNRGLIRVRRFIRDDDDLEKNIFQEKIPFYISNEKVIGIGTALMDMNIRLGPGVDYESISVVLKDQKVEVLEILENGWMRIKCSRCKNGYGFTSYKNGKYYSYEEFPKEPLCNSNEKVIGIGTALMDMNIRLGPGVDYESISVVLKDQKVEVLEILENGWMRIKCDKDKNGYAFTSYKNGQYYSYEEFKNI